MIEFHCSECHEYGRLKEHEGCGGTITYEGYPHAVDPHDPRAFLLWWLRPLEDESEFTAHTRWAVANLMDWWPLLQTETLESTRKELDCDSR